MGALALDADMVMDEAPETESDPDTPMPKDSCETCDGDPEALALVGDSIGGLLVMAPRGDRAGEIVGCDCLLSMQKEELL